MRLPPTPHVTCDRLLPLHLEREDADAQEMRRLSENEQSVVILRSEYKRSRQMSHDGRPL